MKPRISLNSTRHLARLGIRPVIDVAALDQLGDHLRIEEALEHARRLQPLGALLQIGDGAGGKVKRPAESERREHRPESAAAQGEPGGGQHRQRHPQQHEPDRPGALAAHETEGDEGNQRQRQRRQRPARNLAQPVAPVEIVDRRRQHLDPGIGAAQRSQPQILEARRGGADDDDLAAELIPGALRVLAQAVEIDVGVGDMAPAAAPVEQDVLLGWHWPPQIAHDPRRQRGEAPAGAVAVDVVAAADAVAVESEIDQAPAHALGAGQHHQRHHQRHPRLRAGPGQRLRADGGGHVGDPRALAIGIERHRQPHVRVPRHRLGEGGVVFGAIDVGLVEQHVEGDGAGLLRGDGVDQLAVHRARPGPAAGQLVHGFEAALVDIDDHHPVRRRATGGVAAQQDIAAALVDQRGQARPGIVGQHQTGEDQRQSQPLPPGEAAEKFCGHCRAEVTPCTRSCNRARRAVPGKALDPAREPL